VNTETLVNLSATWNGASAFATGAFTINNILYLVDALRPAYYPNASRIVSAHHESDEARILNSTRRSRLIGRHPFSQVARARGLGTYGYSSNVRN
jgi:hypothetical protein